MTNLPVSGVFSITCPYHKLGTKWAAGHHTGIDLVSLNRRVYGTCDGTVYQLGYDKAYGNFIVIRNIKDNTFHWFCHLKTLFVKQGQNVSRLTSLGIMGSTGNTTGVHLHFEIRKHCNCYDKTEDPAAYMGITNKKGIYNSKNYEIKENKKDYNAGDVIYIPVKFTGSVQGNCSLIELGNKQFWVYNSSLNISKTKLKAVICFVDKYKIMIECDTLIDNERQFWIDKGAL